MFQMHAKLLEDFDVETLNDFKQELDTIPYTYAEPYKGLGMGSSFVSEIAGWYEDVSRWCLKNNDYDDAVDYLDRALDYYCDPVLEYDFDIIDETKERMRGIVNNFLDGIYDGSHDID